MLSSALISGSTYNDLPAHEDQVLPEQGVIDSLGALFIKHGVHQTYGLALLHKHFDMKADEVMVHDGLRCAPAVLTKEGSLIGRNFYLHDGVFQAYEYEQGPNQDVLDIAFLSALKRRLIEGGIHRTLALTKIDIGVPPSEERLGSGRSHVCAPAVAVIAEEATEWRFDAVNGSCFTIVSKTCLATGYNQHKWED
ncbi:hypothetical protein ANO11243_019880 [Dothideomycetidae sp. 11243]|nr:hypothetical protein ANO11243_019880 [fungal sp. No.11243]